MGGGKRREKERTSREYHIMGNFGGGFNLAIGESTAKLKIGKFLSSVHVQYAMRINCQILNLPMVRFSKFNHAKISCYTVYRMHTSNY